MDTNNQNLIEETKLLDTKSKRSYLQIIQKEKNKNQILSGILKGAAIIVSILVISSMQLNFNGTNHLAIILPIVVIMLFDLYFAYFSKYYTRLYELVRNDQKDIDFDLTPYYNDDFLPRFKSLLLGIFNIGTWLFYLILIGMAYIIAAF